MGDPLHDHLQSLSAALYSRNGDQLAALISLPMGRLGKKEDKLRAQALASAIGESKDEVLALSRRCYNTLRVDQPISDMETLRLRALSSFVGSSSSKGQNLGQAYQHLHAAFTQLLEFMESNGEFSFLAAALVRMASDLRILASLADRGSSAGVGVGIGSSSSGAGAGAGAGSQRDHRAADVCIRECQESIRRAFSLVARDRLPLTDAQCKKRHIFAIANVLFKIYFRINTLKLMEKVVNVVNTVDYLAHLKYLPVTDVVTYQYYTGRLAMLEDRLDEARENLNFALRHTPLSHMHNRRLILACLVPIEMSQGVLPTAAVARAYGFECYTDIAAAVSQGNLRRFNELVLEHRATFIRIGVFLVVEQLKSLVYRNLFKRIYAFNKDNTRLSVERFREVVQWMGEDLSLDEVECVLANLIFCNRVKGYLSHTKRILVVGKTDPFPSAGVVTKRARSS